MPLLLLLMLNAAAAKTLEGHIIHVADGDTITVLGKKPLIACTSGLIWAIVGTPNEPTMTIALLSMMLV